MQNKPSKPTNEAKFRFTHIILAIHIQNDLLSHGVEIFSSEQTMGNDKYIQYLCTTHHIYR